MIELLVAVVLATLLGVGAFQFLGGHSRRAGAVLDSSRRLENLQRMQTRMEIDIGQAGYDPSDTSLVPIRSASEHSIVLQADLGQSTCSDFPCTPVATPSSLPTVTYLFDSATHTLKRNGVTVLTDVETFSFAYEYYNGARWVVLDLDPATKELLSTDRASVERVNVAWKPLRSSDEISRKKNPKLQTFTVFLRNPRPPMPTP